MPKAEIGSSKWLGNKMKAKGLQRLRWYCQACEKQCRDENGFKQHTMSEGHVRAMTLISEDSKRVIKDYSSQFKRDFIAQLRTAHNEKPVHANQFYQSYIANKEHVHMNSTQWASLTEFVKFLGKEGVVRVKEEEDGKGVFIAWVDDSADALRRRDAVRKRERQDKGDEEREQMMLRAQIERAQAKEKELWKEGQDGRDEDEHLPSLADRPDGEKVSLQFAAKKAALPPALVEVESSALSSHTEPISLLSTQTKPEDSHPETKPVSVNLAFGQKSAKPKNVFAAASKKESKNPLASKRAVRVEPPKKMSEAERIMKEEMAREKAFAQRVVGGGKRMRFS